MIYQAKNSQRIPHASPSMRVDYEVPFGIIWKKMVFWLFINISAQHPLLTTDLDNLPTLAHGTYGTWDAVV